MIQIAKEIAKDHLSEDPAYYKKVETIEHVKSPVQELRAAKAHSDAGRYDQKAAICGRPRRSRRRRTGRSLMTRTRHTRASRTGRRTSGFTCRRSISRRA
jgi:hypothetical protein